MKKQTVSEELRKKLAILSTNTSEQTEKNEEEKANLTHKENAHLAEEEREKWLNKLMEADVKDRDQDRDQRKDFANKIFNFMCWYLAAVFFIIILKGITTNCFYISDDIILALLGTTAVEVIGTFAFVAKYLFGSKS